MSPVPLNSKAERLAYDPPPTHKTHKKPSNHFTPYRHADWWPQARALKVRNAYVALQAS